MFFQLIKSQLPHIILFICKMLCRMEAEPFQNLINIGTFKQHIFIRKKQISSLGMIQHSCMLLINGFVSCTVFFADFILLHS